MSHQPVIDGFEFASAGAKQQGGMPISGFARLRDVLVSDAGEVAYEIEGMRDERGRPSLRILVRGMLQLRCQRCLERLPFEVRADQTLVLAATQAEIEAEAADANAPDRVLAGKEMPVRELIEDELILALPYAPRHEACASGASSNADERADRQASPFAGLRDMMHKQ